jgi:hypothetical protein
MSELDTPPSGRMPEDAEQRLRQQLATHQHDVREVLSDLLAASHGSAHTDDGLLVPVDVGKLVAMAFVAAATGERLVAPFMFTLDRPGLAEFVQRVERVVGSRGEVQVEVGVEAASHHYRPVTALSVLPADWTLLDLNPAMRLNSGGCWASGRSRPNRSIWSDVRSGSRPSRWCIGGRHPRPLTWGCSYRCQAAVVRSGGGAGTRSVRMAS